MDIKAVVFDMDGTLADTIPLTVHSLKEVTRELTGKVLGDAEILKEFGPIDTEIIKKFVDNDKKEESVEAYVRHFDKNFKDFVKPMDGIPELLEYLKSEGFKVGLFTGRSLRVTEIILENLHIKEYFDEILSGDFTTKPKPDPEGILKILGRLGVEAAESMYVGDFDVDIAASRAAGTLSVLALWSSTGSEDLVRMKPDKYFYSPAAFVAWLRNLNTV